MQRLFVLLVLPCLLAGCATFSSEVGGSQSTAQRCAKGWKAKGFEFDPGTMTCEEMYTRAQALRNAAYWQKRGYLFDPNTMTAEEMDARVFKLRQKGIRRYRDPNLAEGRSTASRQAAAAPAPDGATEQSRRANSAPMPDTGTKRGRAGNSAPVARPASSKNGTTPQVAAGGGNEIRSGRDRMREWLLDVTITQVRRKYPQYDDLDDLELARSIHTTYFSEMPFAAFAQHFLGAKR